MRKKIKFRAGVIPSINYNYMAFLRCKTPEEAENEYNKIVDRINEETDKLHSIALKQTALFFGSVGIVSLVIGLCYQIGYLN